MILWTGFSLKFLEYNIHENKINSKEKRHRENREKSYYKFPEI